MILRSVMKHVRDQNWVAVGLDFLIVVVGVFIGIQVANWNDARVQEARDHVLLDRLQADFERIATWGDENIPQIEDLPVQTKRLIDLIRSGEPARVDDAFRAMADASVEVWAGAELSPTYEELVATGTLSRIRSRELRRALSDYARQRESAYILLEQQLDVRDTGAMEGAIRFRTSDDDYEATKIAESVDWDALKATEPHLQIVLRNQVLRARWQRSTYESAKTVLQLLEEAGASLPDDESVSS